MFVPFSIAINVVVVIGLLSPKTFLMLWIMNTVQIYHTTYT